MVVEVAEVNVKVLYEIEVRDKYGRLVKKIEKECKSFVKNFLRGLFALMQTDPDRNSLATADVVDTGGNTVDFCGGDAGGYVLHVPYCVYAESGDDNYGIVIGSGTTTPTPDDYNLASKIGNSTLSHGECVVESVTVSGNTVTLTVKRTFENISGSTVTINEIGLVVKHQYKDAGGTEHTYYILIIRDVLDTPVDVLSGGLLTVKYKIKTTT